MGLFIIGSVLISLFSTGPEGKVASKQRISLPPAAMGTRADSLYLSAGTITLPAGQSGMIDRNAKGAELFEFDPDPDRYYVIQLDGPMTRDREAAMAASGLKLGSYLPMNAYVVPGNQISQVDLSRLDFIRWVGPFRDEWKISKSLTARWTFETDERKALEAAGRQKLMVGLFDGADLAAALKGLEGAGAVVQDVQIVGDQCQMEIDIDSGSANTIASISEIQYIAVAPEGVARNATTTWVAQSNVNGSTPLWNAGLHGENQVIGLIDWGLDANHCAFSDVVPFGPAHRKILSYVANSVVPGSFGYHGTFVGCILAGNQLANTEANFRGMAYNAKLVMQHYTGLITSTNVRTRLQYAHELGARIHSNSWGSNTDTTYSAWPRDIDLFSRENQEDVVVVAIINGSSASLPGSLRTPENAKNCLAVASTQDTPNQELHGSGARGPTTDGRQKPEIWIPGCPTSANVNTVCGPSIQPCATSWAAPAVSGFASLVRQYFANGFYPTGAATPTGSFKPTGALIRAVLTNSAVDMTGFMGYFGSHEGWGRVLLDDALYFAGQNRRLFVSDVRNENGLATGEVDSYKIGITSPGERLKITLVWTDVPATLGATFTPVNNLDLVVTDPSGNIYKGNVFSGVNSITGGTADIRNNTEQVHITNPAVGRWFVNVNGTAVNSGTQGYAVVVTGALVDTASP